MVYVFYVLNCVFSFLYCSSIRMYMENEGNPYLTSKCQKILKISRISLMILGVLAIIFMFWKNLSFLFLLFFALFFVGGTALSIIYFYFKSIGKDSEK